MKSQTENQTRTNIDLTRVTETPDMGIVMPDGCRLSARVWMPDDAADNPVPAILEFLPYRKRDGTVARDALTHPYFAAHGYACVRVDMRGNGDSEGLMEDEYTSQEWDDCIEVMRFLEAQPWCTGKVGMIGISWGGFNGLQVAALNPPQLKAVITLCSTVDRYADDIHYKGGCLLNENLGWGATMWSYSSRPPDPALVGDKWREMWLERLKNEPFLPKLWASHPKRDDYWKHGSVCEDYSAIKAKVLAVGGWGDAYKNAVPQLVENLDGAKGIIGPWVHKYPHFAPPEPRIGFLQEALRWWDRWLKDEETGVENDPDMRRYVMDGVRPKTFYERREGRWIVDQDYGGDGHSEQLWKLSADGLVGGDEEADPPNVIISSPQHCGMDGGEYCAIWLGPELPGDQRSDDAMSACFDTRPLEQDTEIVGAPRIRLTLSSDKAAAQIAVRLCHVHPDGASTRITYGVLNLTHREGHEGAKPLVPGEPVEVDLALDHIAYQVPKGHRLRIAVSSSYWPLLWPMPEAATLTLTAGRVMLPARPGSATRVGLGRDECVFPEPDAAPAWKHEVIREGSNTRRVETDMATGLVTLVIEDDFGKQRDLDHGLVTGEIARERWTIHPDDPLLARGETHWTQELERDGVAVRTETYADMWMDADGEWQFDARVEAFEGEALVFERSN